MDDKDYHRACNKRWFGIDRKNSKPSILGERVYDISEIGYKYHMNDLSAAMGLGNLEDFKKIFSGRAEIADCYFKEFKNVSGIKLLNYKNDRQSSNWLFTMLVENRIDFIKHLKDYEIPSSVTHLRIDKNSIFGGITPGLTNMEVFNEKQISIPVHSDLTNDDVELIVKTIKKGW